MSKKANPKLIGSFVIGAAVLVVAGVAAFGSGQWFAPIEGHVSFFRGSVQGLRVGAPVTFRGVPIGQVTDIDLFYNVDKLKFVTEVLYEVDPDAFTEVGGDFKEIVRKTAPTEEIERLIEKGLRAQLVQTSFVTGQLAVTIDMFPGTEAKLFGLVPDRTEIPTTPSTVEKLEETIKNIAKKLENISIEEITDDLQATTKAIRELATRPELQEVIVNANEALKEATVLFANLNTRVDPLADSVEDTLGEAERLLADARPAISDARKTLAGAQKALARAEKLMATAEGVIQPGSPLHFELVSALREVAGAARSLRSLADSLERNPNSLLFGRKAPGGR